MWLQAETTGSTLVTGSQEKLHKFETIIKMKIIKSSSKEWKHGTETTTKSKKM